MSKKDFSGGLSSLLGDNLKPKRGRPKKSTRIIKNASQEGTREGDTRATFIVKEDLLNKAKAIAYWERCRIMDVINQSLEELIAKYEEKNGIIKPIPKNK